MFDVIHDRYKRRRRRPAAGASPATAAGSTNQIFQLVPSQHVHVQRGQCTCSQQVIAQRFLQQ